MEDVLTKATAAGYSRDEVESMVNLGTNLAAKAVIKIAINAVRDQKKGNRAVQNKLIDELTAIMPAGTGYVSLTLEKDFIFCVSLAEVKADYRPTTQVPTQEVANDLMDKYNFIKQAASAYWQQFQVSHPDIYTRLTQFCKNINFTALVIDSANPTTMYFDATAPMRAGIFVYALIDGQIKYI